LAASFVSVDGIPDDVDTNEVPDSVSVNFGEFDTKLFRAVSSNLAIGPGLFFKLHLKFRVSFLGRQPIKNDGALKVINDPVHARMLCWTLLF
jgi:hypothetical protein